MFYAPLYSPLSFNLLSTCMSGIALHVFVVASLSVKLQTMLCRDQEQPFFCKVCMKFEYIFKILKSSIKKAHLSLLGQEAKHKFEYI